MSADTTAQSSSASKPCQRASVSVSVSVAESLSIHHTGASSHRIRDPANPALEDPGSNAPTSACATPPLARDPYSRAQDQCIRDPASKQHQPTVTPPRLERTLSPSPSPSSLFLVFPGPYERKRARTLKSKILTKDREREPAPRII